MTVFDIRGAAREHRGNNSITRTSFRVAGDDTLGWWSERLDELRVAQLRPLETEVADTVVRAET